MKPKQGILIAIEGVDGSGKHTQVRSLRSELERSGLQVAEYSFPDYKGSLLGESLREMLAGKYGNATLIPPTLGASMFALERFEKCERIRADLDAGKVVICDRYVYSNVAHQACRLPVEERAGFQRWLEQLEFDILKLPRPDLTILLDIDDELGSSRRRARSQESNAARPLDDYEKDELSISKARLIYLSLAANLNWMVIPTGTKGRPLDRKVITDEILSRIQPVLIRLK